jgi:hypothetical protein
MIVSLPEIIPDCKNFPVRSKTEYCFVSEDEPVTKFALSDSKKLTRKFS